MVVRAPGDGRLSSSSATLANQSKFRADGEAGRRYDCRRAQCKPFVVVKDL